MSRVNAPLLEYAFEALVEYWWGFAVTKSCAFRREEDRHIARERAWCWS
jgi:hypothetical protein